MIELLQGDCLEKMAEIPDKSVDMICCDLPYGMTQNKWDAAISFDLLWEHYKRICKERAAIALTASQPFTSALVMSNVKMFKYDWCWKKSKGTGHLNAKKQPLRDKEDILIFYEKQCTYNAQMTNGIPYKAKAGKDKTSKTSMTGSYGTYTNFRNDNSGVRYPKQIITIPSVERGSVHPTQKPVALIEYLIKTYTNKGDIVLDNCMGSGTAGVAALNLDRDFIGIELDEKYFEIAKKRIEDAKGLFDLEGESDD